MFKTLRVAGIAAAAAFLCTGNAAAASDLNPVDPAVHAAATTSVSPIAADAPFATPQALAIVPADEQSLPSPGRIDPERAAPVQAPAGVTAAAEPRSLEALVEQHAAAEIADEQFECLASAVYFESRGEPLAGQLAVAEVILNRVKSGRFRSTICDVVKQPSQFSFVRRGVIPAAKRHTAAWSRAVAIAHIAMNDLHDVTGEKSLFFHATYVNPGWGRPKIARIGRHIFYR